MINLFLKSSTASDSNMGNCFVCLSELRPGVGSLSERLGVSGPDEKLNKLSLDRFVGQFVSRRAGVPEGLVGTRNLETRLYLYLFTSVLCSGICRFASAGLRNKTCWKDGTRAKKETRHF